MGNKIKLANLVGRLEPLIPSDVTSRVPKDTEDHQ